MSSTLLIELLTEELPPKALNNMGNHFAQSIFDALQKAELLAENAQWTAFAAPRRLAVSVSNVKAVQPEKRVLKKGVSVAAGMKDGAPTPALLGFARSCGVDVADLQIIHDGKQDVYAHAFTQEGQTLAQLLGEMVQQAVKKLPIPKVMRWGSSSHTFVRPVHGLVVLHGEKVLPINVLGLDARRETLGHRFMSNGTIAFSDAEEYDSKMREQGRVIASFPERKALISEALQQQAAQLNAQLASDETLLDEVAALVEYPVVLQASFDERFLAVPQECLILTMQQNQKYFPLLDADGKLINRFLLVANIDAADPSHIIQGNERVLRARLSDAEFFYQQDLKAGLASRLPKLENVVYHNKIGSQAQRIERLQNLAAHIAVQLGGDKATAERAARLAKADLPSEMVGEFPELQGTMGRYYALADGETAEIAQAIEQHYWPRFAGDRLPEGTVATAVSLADKLETLVGIWGIGLVPTGDKDPYALRRAALGVVRILMHQAIELNEMVAYAVGLFPSGLLAEETANEVAQFIRSRLAVYLQNDYPQDVVAAVLARQINRLDDLTARLDAVAQFKRLPEAQTLAAANKRVQNLLKKADGQLGQVQDNLLVQDEERALFAAAQQLQPQVQRALAERDFAAALNVLAGIKPAVDAFFENVMVMADDETVRHNRLSLLQQLAILLNAVADIAQLDGA